jgi:hypothetical protein
MRTQKDENRFNTAGTLQFAGIVGPMEQCLALCRPATKVAGTAVGFDLADVAADGLPPFYLALIFFRNSAPHIISAVPLEPAAWIGRIDPAFAMPFG